MGTFEIWTGKWHLPLKTYLDNLGHLSSIGAEKKKGTVILS